MSHGKTKLTRRLPTEQRVGDILSDSNSELSSLADDDVETAPIGAVEASQSRRQVSRQENMSSSSEASEDAYKRKKDAGVKSEDQATVSVAKIHQRPANVPSMRRKNSKWYDSDDDNWSETQDKARRNRTSSHSEVAEKTPEVVSPGALSGNPRGGTLSPEKVPPPPRMPAELGAKRSSLQRLVDKIHLSPFGSRRKTLETGSPASSGPDTPRGMSNNNQQQYHVPASSRVKSPMGEIPLSNERSQPPPSISTVDRRPSSRRASQDPSQYDINSPQNVVAPRRESTATPAESAMSRRRSNMVQSPTSPYEGYSNDTPGRRGSELPASGDALSPGQRKTPGAFPGRPGSGVLLEGWLRQKQRRGVKGMKKWNSRYFVLYAKTNEIRYYADVVQSAWGPIPLGEIGSISLRLIQRIGKPSHPKYKGCRFDITCRNTWGTHYADDYVSSEDENHTSNNNNSVNGDESNSAARSGDKTSTPKSSRVYSLIADSPPTAHAWVNMLDSLLIRSANSPRVDVGSGSGSGKLKKQGSNMGGSTKMTTRRRSSALETESVVVVAPGENVPRVVVYAINYIFDSTPGIETEHFYEKEPEPVRLKIGLQFLNQLSTGPTPRTPSKEELERVLDPITAGAIVKLWLKQLEQPIVPFELFEDFASLAADARNAKFELHRNLKVLVNALPPRNFAMLACLLFHLNDVNEYASKNGMDAAALASLFSEFIVRPRDRNIAGSAPPRDESLRLLVEEMISHVDAIIDEKEAEILNRV